MTGTAFADCEPGQSQTFCGPRENAGSEDGNRNEPSTAAKAGNQAIKTWSQAQQTPLQMDQGSGGSDTAESLADVVSPGLGTRAKEARQEANAEADRLTADALDSAADAVKSGISKVTKSVSKLVRFGF